MPDAGTKQWYDFEELAAYLQVSDKLLRKYVSEGSFPGPIKLSSRKSAYHYSDLPVLEWLLTHRHRFGKGEFIEEPEES